MQVQRTSIVKAAFLSMLLGSAAMAEPVKTAATLPRAEVEGIIKDYLMSNPKVILEAVEKYRETQEAEAKEKAEKTIVERAKDLYNDPLDGTFGDASKADVTLVEFFDYHCGYCKHFLSTVQQLTKEDSKLRVVFKELPILAEDSRLAAKAALAVHKVDPKKYFEYHTALMTMPRTSLKDGAFTEGNLTQAATKLGVPADKFTAAFKSAEIEAQLEKNMNLAKDLGIAGTPAVVVNRQLFPGAADIGDLKKAIEEQRKAPAKPGEAQ